MEFSPVSRLIKPNSQRQLRPAMRKGHVTAEHIDHQHALFLRSIQLPQLQNSLSNKFGRRWSCTICRVPQGDFKQHLLRSTIQSPLKRLIPCWMALRSLHSCSEHMLATAAFDILRVFAFGTISSRALPEAQRRLWHQPQQA